MVSEVLFFLCLAAFAAGFVDAVVGGGGLIQMPSAFLLLPELPAATVIGSLKIPSFSGTLVASLQYIKHVKIHVLLLCSMGCTAFAAAYAGSQLLTKVSNDFVKPILFVILVVVALYTFFKKDFGAVATHALVGKRLYLWGFILSLCIGFYDGFVGPGTGSFFVLSFVAILGFDFVQASAHAKLVNLATNTGSIVLFLLKGKILWSIALPMAVSNALGGWLGAKTALRKGNGFVRLFFLFVVLLMLMRFGYAIFFG